MDFTSLIFPRKCLKCGKEESYIGLNCLSKVYKPKPICPMCGKASTNGMTHEDCKTPLGLDGLTSIWDYDGVIRKAILTLKYKYATEVAKELSQTTVRSLSVSSLSFFKPSLLIPIPLHWYRQNYRGFNQSEEMGKIIAKKLGLQFTGGLLVRQKLTLPQAELKAKDRVKNIRGVFSLSPNNLSLLTNSSIILFDDVWTTGSTMKEAAKILNNAGVKRVWALTIAR